MSAFKDCDCAFFGLSQILFCAIPDDVARMSVFLMMQASTCQRPPKHV